MNLMDKHQKMTKEQNKRAVRFGRLVGENIAKRRMAKGWSQEMFALMAGIDPKTVSKAERGLSFPGRDIVIKMTDALECEPSDLYVDLKKRNKRRNEKHSKYFDFFDEVNELLLENEEKSDEEIEHLLIQFIFEKYKRQ